jgi:hypothetical protein
MMRSATKCGGSGNGIAVFPSSTNALLNDLIGYDDAGVPD